MERPCFATIRKSTKKKPSRGPILRIEHYCVVGFLLVLEQPLGVFVAPSELCVGRCKERSEREE
jgi:hypothetical protein